MKRNNIPKSKIEEKQRRISAQERRRKAEEEATVRKAGNQIYKEQRRKHMFESTSPEICGSCCDKSAMFYTGYKYYGDSSLWKKPTCIECITTHHLPAEKKNYVCYWIGRG